MENPDLENTIFQFLEKLSFVQNYLEKVTAIYDYNADKEDELTFQVFVVIRVTYLPGWRIRI